MTAPTQQQREAEWVEMMFRVNHHPLAEMSSTERRKLEAALAAVLPVIRAAVLEEAATVAEDQYEPTSMASGVLLHRLMAANIRGASIAAALRALAKEAGV